MALSGGTLSLSGAAQYPLAVTGFNADVIYAVGEASASAGTGAGVDNSDYVLYETGVPSSPGGKASVMMAALFARMKAATKALSAW